MENEYYVYIHFKKDTNIPFYVGKGKGKRAYTKHKRNKHWGNIVKKYGYNVYIVEEGLTNDESLWFERYWELQLKTWGFDLCNINDCGLVNPVMVGKKHPMYGKHLSIETKNKLREVDKSYTQTKEYKLNMSKVVSGEKNGMFGKNHTEETKNRISFIRKSKGLAKGEKHGMFGKNHTEESKLKMSVAKKGVYDGQNNPSYINKKSGLPLYVSHIKKSKKNPYRVRVKGAVLGYYPTIEEAVIIRDNYLEKNV